MFIGLNWRGLLEGGGPLGNAVLKELESLIAAISAWSSVEHDSDGTHTDITAQSVEVTAASIDYAINVISGLASLGGGFSLPGIVTPDQIAANQNNYDPTGLQGAFCMRLATDASRSVTGLLAPPPAAGRLVLIVNIGANDLVLVHESASSDAENRFNFSGAADVTLTALSTLLIYYDSTSERWIALGGSGTTPHDLLSVTHPDTTPAAPVVGDVIVATRSLGNIVDSSKFWADGQSYGGISTVLDTGSLLYWLDGGSGIVLPTPIVAGATTWQRQPIGSVGQVLGVVFDGGDLKVEWVDASSSGGGGGTGAKAYRSTDLSTAYNTVTPVPMSAVEFDTGGYWSALSPSGFTIAVAGVYIVMAQSTLQNAAFGLFYDEIFVNGVKKASSENALGNTDPSYGDYDPAQVSAILNLAAGDFVEFRVRSVRLTGANTTVIGGQERTWFAIASMEAGGSGGGSTGATLPISLTTDVSGILPIVNGGTGQTAVGTDGQFVKVASGLWVPTFIAETDIADGSIFPRLAANETIAGTWDFTPGLKERGRSAAVGEWTAVAYNAANFTTSGGGAWTVDLADQRTFSYALVGKTMLLAITLADTDVGAAPGISLQIALPGGFTCQNQVLAPLLLSDAGGANVWGYVFIAAGGVVALCRKIDNSNWTVTAADNTSVFLNIAFEVQ